MKSMKLSAVVFGLAATAAMAQSADIEWEAVGETAPAEQAAAPAEQAAAPADTAAAAAAPADTAAAAAAPADTAAVAAAPADTAAAAAAPADTAAVAAADSAAAPAAEPVAEAKGPEFKISGEAEADAYILGYGENHRAIHSFSSTFDLNFDVKFNDKWSAFVGLEADDVTADPEVRFNGAYVQYQNSLLAFKIGDMTYAEGAFNYYRYDDPAEAAAGMKENNMRGVELDIVGIQLAIGLSTDAYTIAAPFAVNADEAAYFVHLAYDLNVAGQTLRPYVQYKGYDLGDVNRLRAGLDVNLSVFNDLFKLHAVYGFFDDQVAKSNPKISHTVLAEPTISKGKFSVTGAFFYAFLTDKMGNASWIDVPERLFVYAEPAVQFTESLKVGVMGEYHTNTLDNNNDNNEFAYLGPKVYFTPTEFIDMDFFAAAILPMGDGDGTGTLLNYTEDDNFLFDFGAEVIFKF